MKKVFATLSITAHTKAFTHIHTYIHTRICIRALLRVLVPRITDITVAVCFCCRLLSLLLQFSVVAFGTFAVCCFSVCSLPLAAACFLVVAVVVGVAATVEMCP